MSQVELTNNEAENMTETDSQLETRFNAIENDMTLIKDELSKLSEFLMSASEEKKEKLSEKSKNIYHNVKEKAAHLFDGVSDEDIEMRQYIEDKIQCSSQKLVDKTKEKPLTAIVAAVGVGLLVGFLLKK